MLPAPTARLEGQNDEKEGGGTTHTHKPGYGSPFLASTWSALASHYPDAFPMSAEDGGEKDAFFWRGQTVHDMNWLAHAMTMLV
jgi:hypothetical protein